MRRILLLLVPGLAVADSRIDLAPMPELTLLEPAYHLDRGEVWERRSKRGILASIGIGYERGLAAEGTIAAGLRAPSYTASASSELVAAGNDFVRGRHQALVWFRTDGGHEDSTGGIATLGASLEHGQARALAPVAIGPGRRNHASAFGDALIAFDDDGHDAIWGLLVRADGSATKWLDAPLLDNAYRGALALGLAIAPEEDDELPRGRVEGIVARVEHGRIMRKLSAAGGVSVAEVKTRTIDVMSGLREFTGWIDHEMLFAVTARFGGKWLEVESAGRTATDTMFAMELGTHLKWLKRRGNIRELGFTLAREPTTSADGQHILAETRLEILGSAEDRRYVIGARGGISWIVPQQGAGDVDTLKRYATGFEGFVKVGGGFEIGGYHVMAYEPSVAGDPWASPRVWSTEAGALARWRPRK